MSATPRARRLQETSRSRFERKNTTDEGRVGAPGRAGCAACSACPSPVAGPYSRAPLAFFVMRRSRTTEEIVVRPERLSTFIGPKLASLYDRLRHLTHIPPGIVVSCRTEVKLQNKEAAMRVLASRLAPGRKKEAGAIGYQVRTVDRSERIRTTSRNRIADHVQASKQPGRDYPARSVTPVAAAGG